MYFDFIKKISVNVLHTLKNIFEAFLLFSTFQAIAAVANEYELRWGLDEHFCSFLSHPLTVPPFETPQSELPTSCAHYHHHLHHSSTMSSSLMWENCERRRQQWRLMSKYLENSRPFLREEGRSCRKRRESSKKSHFWGRAHGRA